MVVERVMSDAIRWVLGEQKTKQLRGNSMQDVIFAGSEKRKRLSFCEVTIVLDNSTRTLDIDYDEVAIGRKLYRSGESEYLINKTQCRRKDIIDILHDSGIGRDGYSIIGQGQVQKILLSKPIERRAIFEEAAGISKYKQKKIEAERKLNHASENLTRVDDITSEVERQLKPLMDQSSKAKKFLTLSEQLKKFEINNYIYNYDSASDRKGAIRVRIEALLEETATRTAELEKAMKDYEDTFDEFTNIDEKMKGLYDKKTNLQVSLEKKSGESGIVREKIIMQEEELSRVSRSVNELSISLESAKTEKSKKECHLTDNQNNIERLMREIEEINVKYGEIMNELTIEELADENNQKEMFTSLANLGESKAELSALETEQKI